MTFRKINDIIKLVQNIEQEKKGDEVHMSFDYRKLKGKIKEIFDTQVNFALAMGWSERTMSLKVNGKRTWNQQEIARASELLKLSDKEIIDYFFNKKVQSF